MNNGEPWNKLLACARIFTEMQAMEPMLRGGYGITITRSGDHVVSCKVYAWGSTAASHRHKVRAKDVTNEAELDAEMYALWCQLVAKKLVETEVVKSEGKEGNNE